VFSDRLRTLRGELKQAEFARRVGIAQNTYSRYESGERIPDIEVLVRLAARLGVSADWLLGLDSKDAVPAVVALPDQAEKSRAPVATAYCPACGQKDVTIASQAESIVNLTRSLTALAGQKKAFSSNVTHRSMFCFWRTAEGRKKQITQKEGEAPHQLAHIERRRREEDVEHVAVAPFDSSHPASTSSSLTPAMYLR